MQSALINQFLEVTMPGGEAATTLALITGVAGTHAVRRHRSAQEPLYESLVGRHYLGVTLQ